MLTDEQLTEIWRRLQSIELSDLGEMVDGEFYLRVWPNDALYRPGSVAQGDFIANAPADIEALLTEVKRLHRIVENAPTDAILHALADEIAREYNTPQYDRESTEPPPVIEDQLDNGELE